MARGVVVGEAGRKGKGVFAARRFRRGEVIMRFRGRLVHRGELPALSAWEVEHLGELSADTYQLLPAPRCYLNHACDPNAISSRDTVLARRDIETGAEITIDYRLNAHDREVWELDCLCEEREAPHRVLGDFFTLAPEVQREYLPYTPDFISEEYQRRAAAGE